MKDKFLYDAMLALWRRMMVEIFHAFVAAVDKMYTNKPKVIYDPVWSKKNVCTLINFFRP